MRLLLLAAMVVLASVAVHADTPIFTLLDGAEGKFVGSGSFVLPFQTYEIKHDFSNFSTFSRAIYLNYSFFFLDESFVTLPYSGASSGVSHWILSDALRERGFRMDVLVPVKSSGAWDWSGAKLGWNENTYHANNASGGQSTTITTCFDQSDLTKIIDGCTYYSTMDIQKLDTSSTVAHSRIQDGMLKYFSWYGGTGTFSVMPTVPNPTNPAYVGSAGYVIQQKSNKVFKKGIISANETTQEMVPRSDTIVVGPVDVIEIPSQESESILPSETTIHEVLPEIPNPVPPKSEKVVGEYPDAQIVYPPVDLEVVNRVEYSVGEEKNTVRFLFWEFESPFEQTKIINKKKKSEPNPWWAFLFGQ